ncbi:M56 family metallopeptidase [Hymenobacter bucti]|uniref:M56 family metallopeptidase n=1 Tax=Hymenobacter bucti TaxID=1844114 RepID=A0ABW4QMU9_9BACT
MEATLLYLLKANVVLALFAAAYYGLLRRLTFFKLNRAFLLLALVFAAVYPALPVPALLPAVALPALPAATLGAASADSGALGPATPRFDWQLLILGIYALGTGALLLRLLGQLLSLAWVRQRTQPLVVLGQPVRRLAGLGGPFSFGRDIYLSDSTLADTQHLPAALRHEQAHVRQHHTFDVLLAQVITALAWPNPAAWLLRRAVLDNLEYLADHAALQTGLDRRAYQYSLLHQQPGGVPAPALAFHFSFLTLKNRITMLNQPASTTGQLGRYLLAAPLVMALALGYSGARAQTVTAVVQPAVFHPNIPDNALYYLDGQPSSKQAIGDLPPSTIFDMDILQDEPANIKRIFGNTTATSAVIITTRANANSPAVLDLIEKGDLGSGYTHTPAQANAVTPKALAYITQHYPDARLSGEVIEVKRKTTGAVKYQVQLIQGKRPFYAFFTPQGEFLKEVRH